MRLTNDWEYYLPYTHSKLRKNLNTFLGKKDRAAPLWLLERELGTAEAEKPITPTNETT